MAVRVDDGAHGLGRDAVELGPNLARSTHALGGVDNEETVVSFDENDVGQREAHGHIDPVGDLDHVPAELVGVCEELVATCELLR